MVSGRQGSEWLKMDGYDAHVTYKAMKTLRIRVTPPHGDVTVSAPLSTPGHVIADFLREKHAWIMRSQSEVRLRSTSSATPVTGGRVRLWGTWREVVVRDAAPAVARVVGNQVHLHAPAGDDDAARRAVEGLYRREMGAALELLLRSWEPRVGRRATSITLRRMSSRWGSCHPVTARMTFNTALAKFPPEALEFVVVHELVHLLERGHGPVFRAHMTRLLPGWEERRQLLRDGP